MRVLRDCGGTSRPHDVIQSSRTVAVRRTLYEADYHSRGAVSKPLISAKNIETNWNGVKDIKMSNVIPADLKLPY